MNGRKFVGASVLTITLMLGAAGTANAASVEQAQILIGLVQTSLYGYVIEGNNAERTRASLESKLKGASIKLDQSKEQDACVKLVAFIDKVGDLAVANEKGLYKMAPKDATEAQGEAGDAKDEVAELGGLDYDCSPL